MRILFLFIFILCFGFIQAQLKPIYSSENNKYGYVDASGKGILSPRYDFAWNFKEGMSLVKVNEKYGFVNEEGVEVIVPKFDSALPFSDGLAVVKVDRKYGFIDKKGNMVVPAIYNRCDNFHGDRANVCLNKKWQVMIYPPKN